MGKRASRMECNATQLLSQGHARRALLITVGVGAIQQKRETATSHVRGMLAAAPIVPRP